MVPVIVRKMRRMINLRYSLAVLMLALLAAVACSSGSTATPDPVPTTTQSAVGNEGGAVNVLQLPNIADTVERVRPAVVSIVA